MHMLIAHPSCKVAQFSEQIVEKVAIISFQDLLKAVRVVKHLVFVKNEGAEARNDLKLAGEAAESVLKDSCFQLQVDYLVIEHVSSPRVSYLRQETVVQAGVVLLLNRESRRESDLLEEWNRELLQKLPAQVRIIPPQKGQQVE